MNRAEISEYVRCCLEKGGAMWVYSGEPRKEAPHALLTSGQHSNAYVDVGSYLKAHPAERRIFARHLWDLIPPPIHDGFNWVVGADTSSTDLAADVAELAGVGHIRMIKTSGPEGKKQVWAPDNRLLMFPDKVLQVEELITTSVSAVMVREGIRFANHPKRVRFLQFLPVVVDRSNPHERVQWVENSEILPLLRLEIDNYDPADCPYCKAGSEAIKPKEGNNWQLLTGAA